ncbi:MAG: response regulator [Planctomycetia bacterium]|nr:response regulator [Planctomycetia bacterium]
MNDETTILDPAQQATILLIEDDEAVRDSVRMGLVQFGFHVLEAASGDEAVILCQAYAGKIDATVIDMVMPRMWGHEVAARLLEIAPGIKVVYISGHSEEFMLGCGVLKSEDVFFAKPFYPSEVADKIYEMLGIPNPVTSSFPRSAPSAENDHGDKELGQSATAADERLNSA